MTKKLRKYNGERIVSSINSVEKLDSHMQRNEAGPLTPLRKKSTQMGQRLEHRPNIIKFLKENIGVNSLTSVLSMTFLYLTSKSKGTKAKKINKWDHSKLKESGQRRKLSTK